MKMEMTCPNCRTEVRYSDQETLIKCPSCDTNIKIINFVREQQKADLCTAEEKAAKLALEKAEQEKEKAQEDLYKTVRMLDTIQIDNTALTERLKQILEGQSTDRSLQKNMIALLQAIQGGQQDESGFLCRFIQSISARQKTVEAKLVSISEIANQLLHNQSITDMEISTLIDKISDSDQEKRKLNDELIEWFKSISRNDVKRLEEIRRISQFIINRMATLEKEVNQSRVNLERAEESVKNYETKWEEKTREKLVKEYKYAEKLQEERRFDEAQKYYQDVLINGGKDPEVYWRVLQCHYCIEYQRDDDGNQIPTILYPDLNDPSKVTERTNLLEALDSEEKEVKEHYNEKLNAIDAILEKYRQCKHKHEYDVFISVKQTVNTKGDKYYTKDYKIGQDLYTHLKSMGLRVFNSEITKGPPGEEWEPYILAALMSAKVMIVVGTCPEYMETQWIKNEWTRYQWLQKKDKHKERLLLCYLAGNMSVEQLPKGLNPSKEVIFDGMSAQKGLDAALWGIFPHIRRKKYIVTVAILLVLLSISGYGFVCLVNNQPFLPIHTKATATVPAHVSQTTSLMMPTAIITPSPTPTISIIEAGEQNYIIGKELLEGSNPSEGIVYLQTAAEYGNVDAQYLLGKCYEAAIGVSQNKAEAVKYYHMASDQGHAAAQNALGNCYRLGRGVEENKEKAFFYYQQSANQEYAEAQSNLGDCYYHKWGVDTDYEKAVYYYLKAAEQGIFWSYGLGDCYYYNHGVAQDYEKAIFYYTKSAEQGNDGAQEKLGNIYYVGRYAEQDYNKAVFYYQKAADQGNSSAQFRLGKCYYDGTGVDKDYDKAVFYYQKAADQGHKEAQLNLGNCYYTGQGINRDYKQAVLLFQKLADDDNTEAQNNLADCYYYGRGIKTDSEKAVYYYLKSANSGNASGLNGLGNCYYRGYGVEQDYKKAVEYYQKSAEQGNAFAQNSLGDCYYYGNGVEKDLKKAVEYYQKSAEQGNAFAQNRLGECYYFGYGVEQDYKKAVEYYQKSAGQTQDICYKMQKNNEKLNFINQHLEQMSKERGDGLVITEFKEIHLAIEGDALALNYLGTCYYVGEHQPKDYEEAVENYQKSADQGVDKAQNNLGDCYYYCDGVEQDYEKAVYYYQKSAEQGNAMAQSNLGDCYYYGYGVDKDWGKAVEYYQESANQGYALGQNGLGNCYYYGRGVDQDQEKAVHYYQMSADQGNTAALYCLGACYAEGNGVKQDYEKAVSLYQKASDWMDARLQ